MADLNKNKLKILKAHIAEGGDMSDEALNKAIGLNPRYKGFQKYVDVLRESDPDIFKAKPPVEATEGEVEVEVEVEDDDDDDDDMFGEMEEETPEVKPTELKKVEAPKPEPEVEPTELKKVEAPKKAAPAPEELTEVPSEFSLRNANGTLTELELVHAKGGKAYLQVKTDEIVTISIQGNDIEVNLTDLERTDPALVTHYRAISNG